MKTVDHKIQLVTELSAWAYDKRGNSELLPLKLIHLFARDVLLVKKLEIEETKTT